MKSTTSIILKFSLIAGLIIAGVQLGSIAFWDPSNPNMDLGKVIGYGSMTLAFLVLFPAVRSINQTTQYGFGKNLLYCLAIVGIATAIYSLAWTIYATVIDPTVIDTFIDYFMKDLETQHLSAVELAEKKEEFANIAAIYRNPVMCFLITLIEPMPVGIPLALLASGLQFRKNRNNT